MRGVSLSLADRLAAVGFVVLAIGAYLTWGVQPAPATLGLSTPWEATGFVAGRAVVLLPPLGYAALRWFEAPRRVQIAVLGAAALVCVAYPPYRIRQAPLRNFVPSAGFVVVATAGLLFAAGAATRYAEMPGAGVVDRSDRA